MVARHGPALLRIANQFSLCHDDALDAYQRALEIYLRRLGTVDPATEGAWLRVVVKHEAMAIRNARAGVRRPRGCRPRRSGPGRAARGRGHGRGRRARGALGRGAEGAQARRGAGAAAEGRRPLLRRDRQALRVDLHEGQPEHRRGPQAVPEGLQRDRVRRGVRELRAGAGRAGRRHGDERPGVSIRPHLRHCATCRATVRGMRFSRARRFALVAAVRVDLAAADALGRPPVRVQRRRAARAGGGARRALPRRRRGGRRMRDDGRAPGGADRRVDRVAQARAEAGRSSGPRRRSGGRRPSRPRRRRRCRRSTRRPRPHPHRRRRRP